MVYTAIENPTAEQQALLTHLGDAYKLYQVRDEVFLYRTTERRNYRCCMICHEGMGGTNRICKDITCPGHQRQVAPAIAVPVVEVTLMPKARALPIPEIDDLGEPESEPEPEESEEEVEASDSDNSDDSEDSDDSEEIYPDFLDLDADSDMIVAFRKLLRISSALEIEKVGPELCHHSIRTVLEQAYSPRQVAKVRDSIIKCLSTQSISDVVEFLQELENSRRVNIQSDTMIALLLLIGPLYEYIMTDSDCEFSLINGVGHNNPKVLTSSIYICILDVRNFHYDHSAHELVMEIIAKLGASKNPDARSDAHAKKHFAASRKNKKSLTFTPNMYALFTGDEFKAESAMFKTLEDCRVRKPRNFLVGEQENGTDDRSNEIIGVKLRIKASDLQGGDGLFNRLDEIRDQSSDAILKLLKSINCRDQLYELAQKKILGHKRIMNAVHEAALQHHDKFLDVSSQVIGDMLKNLDHEKSALISAKAEQLECERNQMLSSYKQVLRANNDLQNENSDLKDQIQALKNIIGSRI
jgi:hypothetical protein